MNIIKAIIAINPNANVSIEDNDINQITWLNETAVISKSDIETKLVELQTALDAKEYQRKRAEEYPPLIEFAEAYTEKEINGNDTKWLEYKTKYNKVRTDNPKS